MAADKTESASKRIRKVVLAHPVTQKNELASALVKKLQSIALGDGFLSQPIDWREQGVNKSSHVCFVVEYALEECIEEVNGVALLSWYGDLPTTLNRHGYTLFISDTQDTPKALEDESSIEPATNEQVSEST